MSERCAVFAYGSLASVPSAERTLARPVKRGEVVRLRGWRRRWSQARDNLRTEKTFARADDGTIPPSCLGLNVERAAGAGPNGVLLEVSEAELERLDRREIRYDRVDVTADVVSNAPLEFDLVATFTAKPPNFVARPPEGAVILATYARAVRAAFEALGSAELDLFRETTGPPPVEVVEAVLLRHRIPVGNPTEW